MVTPILIGGATGSTGRAATKLLLEKGFPVRALIHKDDERAEKLRALGADIVVGDLLDLRAIRSAFDGIQRAYFVYPIRPGIVQATVHFAEAAREAKAEFIVNMSQRTSRPDAISNSALQHWLAERVFDWAGTSVCHLRPTAFNEWLLYMRNAIRDGRYGVPFGATGKFAPVSAEDQGAVIAAILADPTGHAGQTYELFGPVELTPPEIAAIISKALGKEVRYEQISSDEWVRSVNGMSVPFVDQHLDGIVVDHAQGMMAGTNDVIERLTSREPESVAAFVERHRVVWL